MVDTNAKANRGLKSKHRMLQSLKQSEKFEQEVQAKIKFKK